MPIYEYRCLDCHEVWTRTEHIDEHVAPHEVRCPRCDSAKVEQNLTPFFAKTSRKS
ncbi:MAG TPA: zinc ribbon domain-containing protein [Longimicrobiales bacterium]|nr:zinc ribbon domain-containing protein [Longimicrobiales bacterium]